MTCHPSIHRSTWIVDITLNLPTSKGLIILSGGDLRQRYFFKWFESKRLQPKGGVKILHYKFVQWLVDDTLDHGLHEVHGQVGIDIAIRLG